MNQAGSLGYDVFVNDPPPQDPVRAAERVQAVQVPAVRHAPAVLAGLRQRIPLDDHHPLEPLRQHPRRQQAPDAACQDENLIIVAAGHGLLLLLALPGADKQHRVAQLAACGHGNRAIAERLYVTPRTVETHLTHAFQKLGIRSRADLAAALTAQPGQDGSAPVSRFPVSG